MIRGPPTPTGRASKWSRNVSERTFLKALRPCLRIRFGQVDDLVGLLSPLLVQGLEPVRDSLPGDPHRLGDVLHACPQSACAKGRLALSSDSNVTLAWTVTENESS